MTCTAVREMLGEEKRAKSMFANNKHRETWEGAEGCRRRLEHVHSNVAALFRIEEVAV